MAVAAMADARDLTQGYGATRSARGPFSAGPATASTTQNRVVLTTDSMVLNA